MKPAPLISSCLPLFEVVPCLWLCSVCVCVWKMFCGFHTFYLQGKNGSVACLTHTELTYICCWGGVDTSCWYRLASAGSMQALVSLFNQSTSLQSIIKVSATDLLNRTFFSFLALKLSSSANFFSFPCTLHPSSPPLYSLIIPTPLVCCPVLPSLGPQRHSLLFFLN